MLKLMGIKMNRQSYRFLRDGIKRSNTLKTVAVNNCNVAKSDYLHILTNGMMESKSLETIDLQCNDL